MKILASFLLWGALVPIAHGAANCASDNPSIGRIQARWPQEAPSAEPGLNGPFGPISLQLLPLSQAEARFGPLSIKSRKAMRFFNEYQWMVEVEGDYWLAADSGAWLDVRDAAGALEPLTFNHGLRCAGIHKALKFHLRRGSYGLLVASDEVDKVKIAAELER